MIGYRCIEVDGCTWRDNQGGLFPLSPPDVFNNVSYRTAYEVMSRAGAYFLRWETHFDRRQNGAWWHVVKDRFDELQDLPKKTRYMIRKAKKIYAVKLVDRSEIISKGYAVYSSAYQRYQTHEPFISLFDFQEAVFSLPEKTEFWAVYEGERMVAFSENYIEFKVCFYVTMWLDPEAMSKFAGYLLFHEMERNYLADRKFKYISDGARSLSHDTNIHDFLISKFRFRKAYACLHVVYAPWLGIAVKLAYPIRQMIGAVPLAPFKKAKILLKQEEIRRQCTETMS